MSEHTKIQWADSSANPTHGCDGCVLWNPDSGVKSCYAGILHERFAQTNMGYSPRFDFVQLNPGEMAKAACWPDLTGRIRADKPWMGTRPRHIFVSDMGDALSRSVSFEYLESEIVRAAASEKGQRHRWLWLTKRPERMADFSDWLEDEGLEWPANLYAGCSVIEAKDVYRLKRLDQVGNADTTRFISLEPQWEPIHLGLEEHQVHWVLHGGESGSQAKDFQLDWAYEVMEHCRENGVSYFLKQLGQKAVTTDLSIGGQSFSTGDLHGGDWLEWPEDLRVREVPEC